MRIVGSFFQGTRELTSKEKVLSPKDMQGKKYRGVPIKLWSSMLTGMGAVATPVEVSELATALATGLVVGQENPLPNIYNLKLYEVQKYVMMTNHMQSVLAVFINEKVWQRIPAADRKIIEDTMAEVGKKTLDWDRDTAAKYRKDLEAKGMVFVEEKDGLDIEGVPQGGAGAGRQGLPRVDRLHRADPRGEMSVAARRGAARRASRTAVRWVSLVLLAAADGHAAGADRDARDLQRADVRRRGARALLPDLPDVHRGVVRDQQGGQIRMEEFQGLLPPRPRWFLQLVIELSGVGDVRRDVRRRRRHDRQQPAATRPRRWRCRSGCSWGRWPSARCCWWSRPWRCSCTRWRRRRPEEKHTVLT